MARANAPSIWTEANRAVKLATNDYFPEEWNQETGFDESKLPDLNLVQRRQLAQEIARYQKGDTTPKPLLKRFNDIFEEAISTPFPGEKWIMSAGLLGLLAHHYGLLGFIGLGAANLTLLPGGGGAPIFQVGDQVKHLTDPHRSRGHVVGIDNEDEEPNYYIKWYPQDTDVELHNAYSLVPYGYDGPRAAATVEDSEPANNFGFLKDPHDELYPAAWIGTRMREEARTAILDHINKALAENGYPDAGRFINYSVYGSGASYNWDEDGDFDMQMWVDIDKYNEGKSKEELMTEDDLVADIRRIVQLVNFPSFKDLGLTNGCEGKMLVQYYAKPGEGTKEDNLASKPYACYDLEKEVWYQKPTPITPEFYGEWFILLEPKAKDIATQASAVLESLERNIVEWSFWSQMYDRHQDERFKERAEQAREDAEADKEGAHNMFLNIFKGRMEAYGPEGEGNNDERDLMEKLLEVWGVFQRLRHAVKEALPWETQELPEEPLPTEEPEEEKSSRWNLSSWRFPWTQKENKKSNEEKESKDSSEYDSKHWHIVASDPTKISEAVHEILRNGGGTFNLDLSEAHHIDGYYSSVYGYEQTVSEEDFGESTLNAYLDMVEGHSDYLLGTWVDEGLVYLDLTKHIPDKHTAIEFGLYNRQKAIWDIAGKKAIELDPATFQVNPAFSKVAAWKDLMGKAKRIKDQGRVHILNNQPDHVVGRVEGDHGTYTTQIWRQDPNSQAITMWDCECPWDQYAWQRTRQWKKYEGRPCSHVLALFWTAQQNAAQQPTVAPGQMQLPGMTPQPQAPPPVPFQPGVPNLEGQGLPRPGTEPQLPAGPFAPTPTPADMPVAPQGAPGALPMQPVAPGMQVDPRFLRTAPGVPTDPRFQAPVMPGGNSQPQEPGQGGSFGFPGALSHIAMTEEPWRYRVPFHLYPSGEWTMGKPGDQHVDVPLTDADLWWENGEENQGQYQGHIIFDPEFGEIEQWGIHAPEDQKNQIREEARRRFKQYGPGGNEPGSDWRWSFRTSAFENGTIVRAEMPLVGMDRDGRQWRIPRNSKGEVLSSDEDKTIAIFPLSTGQLQPHLVRVVADTSSFSQSHGSPFIGT
jgi:hypothetical protein